MNFKDKDGYNVSLEYKQSYAQPDGDHVLAIPVYQNQLLFTKHHQRGIEFPGGKKEIGESSEAAMKREILEETGAIIDEMYYIAQYCVHHAQPFKKDVFFVHVDTMIEKSHYYETDGPVLYHSIQDIANDEKSFLLEDDAILQCLERVRELGFYT